VRHASSLAPGTLVQNLTTVIAALALAFSHAPTLTLVILSAVPLLTFIQILAQGIATPLLAAERHSTAVAATRVERAASAIATVKAFNAAAYELARANAIFATLQSQARSLNGVWAATSGGAQFVMMAMFVQGFWFGGKLVRDGKVGAGQVMAVFWACLIATSSLQMCIPQLIVLAKGKAAMAALLALSSEYDNAPSADSSNAPATPTTPTFSIHARPRTLRKLHPTRCTGELALYNVSFAYPSRPAVRALANVSLFLPAGETTFVVGGSGSGKSTVAALLGGLYPLGTTSHPTSSGSTQSTGNTGMVTLDDHPLPLLSSEFLSAHVTVLSQASAASLVLGGRSIADNILAALPWRCSPRRSGRRGSRESAARVGPGSGGGCVTGRGGIDGGNYHTA
jgi:ATP-binding cassette subfamily B (MDR/TAP) protein 1